MDNRPLTPRERIEARRIDKETLRSFLKHYMNPLTYGVFVCEFLALLKFLGIWTALENLIQPLKALVLIPKFCNGLIGVSLTDSTITPAI
jgi:hypothetical protein